MAKLTRAEKLVALLTDRGCKIVEGRSKYIQLSRPERDDFYFIGRNGALRAGRSASSSVSLTDKIKPEIFK